jgi:hypothetical protein
MGKSAMHICVTTAVQGGVCAADNAAAASSLLAAGAVPLLVLCVQEPELSLKRIAASALSDIAKHTPELAQVLVDAGAVSYLAPLLVNQDAKLKRQVSRSAAQLQLTLWRIM